ncbi:MAG: hypothetical protein V1844_21425 [Pseudomonadota bacterium]
MLRKPRKSLGIRRMGRKSRKREPGSEKCGTDHLSVIGAGGREGMRDELLSSGDSKGLFGCVAGRERWGCRKLVFGKLHGKDRYP